MQTQSAYNEAYPPNLMEELDRKWGKNSAVYLKILNKKCDNYDQNYVRESNLNTERRIPRFHRLSKII